MVFSAHSSSDIGCSQAANGPSSSSSSSSSSDAAATLSFSFYGGGGGHIVGLGWAGAVKLSLGLKFMIWISILAKNVLPFLVAYSYLLYTSLWAGLCFHFRVLQTHVLIGDSFSPDRRAVFGPGFIGIDEP